MKNRGKCVHLFWLLGAALLFSAAASGQTSNGVLPGSGFQVMKADWGAGNRRMDVTGRLRRLLTGRGLVKVNNANMGGDPAVGANKVLRISARDPRGHVQHLTYKEGSFIDAAKFYNYGPTPGPPPRPGPPPKPGPPGSSDLQIVRGYYGLNNRTNDVTRRLRDMVRNDTLVVRVTNQNMGGDPAKGADKVLTVVYRYRGRERTSTVKEGNVLRIP